MNIYVASFKQQDIYDYEASIFYNADWWREYFKPGDVVKAGTILKVVGEDGTQWQYDSTKLPAYLIAKEDFTVDSDMSLDGETVNRQALHFGRWNDNGKWYADVINENGAWYDKGYTASDSIWDTCTPRIQYANYMPWTFVTEGVISDYISLQWRDAYNEVGTFTLVLPANEENLKIFQPDRYIMIEKSEKIMIIESIKLNANLMADGFVLQVSGRSLESVLDRRIAFPGIALNTQAYKGDGGLVMALYDLVDAYFINVDITAQESSDGSKYFYYPERHVQFLEFPSDINSYFKREFNASINKNISKEPILDIVTEICQNNNLGFEIIASPRFGESSRCITWKFILYNGMDKSYTRSNKNDPLLIFSPTLNNVRAVATTIDHSNYKNVIFCGTEKDSEGYIDLTMTQPSASQLIGIEMPSVISNLKNKISSKLQENPVTYTGILILAVAANKNTKDYSQTVYDISDHNSTRVITGSMGDYNYPAKPITKEQAQNITVIFYKKFGQDIGSFSKGTFTISDIESNDDPNKEGFKSSTAFGWLTPTILREATSAANSLVPESGGTWPSAAGVAGTVSKTAIQLWFRTFDAYTKESTLTKWLCQTYDRSNRATGLDRREVFVEQENEDNDDWDASAINSWRANTTLITTNSYDDEDSDEEINEKLMTSARKQSGQFNEVRDVDVDIDYTAYTYKKDYDIGDIVQVDDGYGNLDSYMVNAVVISNDTTDGEKIVPEFTRYFLIPKSYIPLEYIRVANMLLPVIFSPRENVENSDNNMNWGEVQPDIGPDIKRGYSGYIDEIFWERRSKWTEFEFDGKYDVRVKSDSSFEPLKPNFALLSAMGYNISEKDQNDRIISSEDLLSYALISSRIVHPLRLGRNGQAAEAEGAGYLEEGAGRYFYQFMGDHAYSKLDMGNNPNYYTVPGIGIKWDESEREIQADSRKGYSTTKYLDCIYRKADDSLRHTFYLNKAITDTSTVINDTCGDNRQLKYSVSYIDEDGGANRLAKKPQFQFAFPYDSTNSYYRQMSDWDYGHPNNVYDYSVDYNNAYNNPGNRYENNPWNRIIYVHNDPDDPDDTSSVDQTALADISSRRKHVALTYSGTNAPQEGAYGQVSFKHTSIDEWVSYKNMIYMSPYNNSSYRYMILGGFAYLNRVSDGSSYTQNIVWHSSDNTAEYSDLNNGVVVYRLKVYEYESSYKDYRWSRYQRDGNSIVDTMLLPFDKGSANNYSFWTAESGVENVDISTRHLAHDYVPVKYIDVGDSKPEDIEIYGLYDTVEQIFIPVNFCPNPQLFGEDHNSNATFIEAGGEIARE